MKAVLLHGLGQTARDWRAVTRAAPGSARWSARSCPRWRRTARVYPELLAGLERRCAASAGAALPVRAFAGRDARARLRRPPPGTRGLADPHRRAGSRAGPAGRLSEPRVPLHAEAGVRLHGAVEEKARSGSRGPCGRSTSERSWAGSPARRRSSAGRGTAPTAARRRNCSRRLPNAELRIIPGAGHEVNRDAPEALAALLREKTA